MKNLFDIELLGDHLYPSPIRLSGNQSFVNESDRILVSPYLNGKNSNESFESAGPREKIFFNPKQVRAAVVTCGGLCPGINSVIRALVLQLTHRYGCKEIIGYKFGYQGLGKNVNDRFEILMPSNVSDIHHKGGTILKTSRGTPPVNEIVDTLQNDKVDMLFTIGGDGTMKGAQKISEEIKKRNLKISVIGIPKTIDNDIPFVRKSFGFETAVEVACESIKTAHIEAESVKNGFGLVKLMGRNAGFIAVNATLATGFANFCLIPEVDFNLNGENGLFNLVKKRLIKREHVVIVVAEGAGQKFFKNCKVSKDKSGNILLGDIGLFLKEKILKFLEKSEIKAAVKYIDPSYIIRSSHANAGDQLFCLRLAQAAVHAAMSGRTNMLIGYWHGEMTHIPFKSLMNKQKRVNPSGSLWFNILETTGQPGFIR